jgi:hypothetical protein
MTIFAAVTMGCPGKLFLMGVLMAIGATVKFDFVPSSLSLWYMTLRACDRSMFSAQRKGGQIVLDQKELRRLEPFDSMTALTSSPVRPRGELTIVWIRLMAISALREGDRRLEIAFDVALKTADLRMLPEQRIFRRRVVKLSFQRNSFPGCRRMA